MTLDGSDAVGTAGVRVARASTNATAATASRTSGSSWSAAEEYIGHRRGAGARWPVRSTCPCLRGERHLHRPEVVLVLRHAKQNARCMALARPFPGLSEV